MNMTTDPRNAARLRQQDAEARQAGFRNHEEMLAWALARQQAQPANGQTNYMNELGRQGPGEVKRAVTGEAEYTPKGLFQYIADKYKQATGF